MNSVLPRLAPECRGNAWNKNRLVVLSWQECQTN